MLTVYKFKLFMPVFGRGRFGIYTNYNMVVSIVDIKTATVAKINLIFGVFKDKNIQKNDFVYNRYIQNG